MIFGVASYGEEFTQNWGLEELRTNWGGVDGSNGDDGHTGREFDWVNTISAWRGGICAVARSREATTVIPADIKSWNARAKMSVNSASSCSVVGWNCIRMLMTMPLRGEKILRSRSLLRVDASARKNLSSMGVITLV